MKLREKLPETNANKYCHIYTDCEGITTIHDTENNETFRIIPETSALGFHLEYYRDAHLMARNHISFEEMKVLALLAGSNYKLRNLMGQGGENNLQ